MVLLNMLFKIINLYYTFTNPALDLSIFFPPLQEEAAVWLEMFFHKCFGEEDFPVAWGTQPAQVHDQLVWQKGGGLHRCLQRNPMDLQGVFANFSECWERRKLQSRRTRNTAEVLHVWNEISLNDESENEGRLQTEKIITQHNIKVNKTTALLNSLVLAHQLTLITFHTSYSFPWIPDRNLCSWHTGPRNWAGCASSREIS